MMAATRSVITALCGGLSLLAAAAVAQPTFDGHWHGTLEDQDSGDCGEGAPAQLERDLVITDGVVTDYNLVTRFGPLAVSGGIDSDGGFLMMGGDRGKGAVAFSGKASGDRITGRWNFEIGYEVANTVWCAGPFEFTREQRAPR